ncbi:nucleotidyltransferase domain-containing protein [Patescibacteria group bacterium]|nr:nucleotidyltransferase domain-containing protein [Patescibacteria group bacterium]
MNLLETKTQFAEDTIYVPDISYLTNAALPPMVDLRDFQGTISLLKTLLSEQSGIEPGYLGTFLFGSVARGKATNGSDIDLLHIYNGFQKKFKGVEGRLEAILGLYGIKSTQLRETIFLEEGRKNYGIYLRGEYLFDKYSVPLLLDPDIVELIQKTTGYHTRDPFSDRPEKIPAVETGPHLLKIDQDIAISLWDKDCLLKW